MSNIYASDFTQVIILFVVGHSRAQTPIHAQRNVTALTIIYSLLFMLWMLHNMHCRVGSDFFSVGGIILGKYYSFDLFMVLSSPWLSGILHCAEYFTNKRSVTSVLTFRWLTTHPIFLLHMIRDV
jgi:hypothetical protein